METKTKIGIPGWRIDSTNFGQVIAGASKDEV